MATHDYVIANASGAAVRSDLNNALAAIVSNNSNATAPATTYAYMWWYDTTNGQLKQRNAANDDWNIVPTWDEDGRLLVGTTSTSADARALFQGSSGGGNPCRVVFSSASSSPSTNATLGALQFSDSGHTTAGEINVQRDGGTWTSGSSQPTALVFSTTADGASSPTERMAINSSGLVSINTTTSGFADMFQITGNGTAGQFCVATKVTDSSSRTHIRFANSNGVVGNIRTSGSTTTYATSSDYRLKENVVPLTGAADRLNQLQVHRFNFIADPDTTVDGFLAHEAQAVVPECVTGEKDAVDDDGNPDYQGIDQSKLVPLLTAALQEALAKIETLETRITALEAAD
jgi:hypothetical protein